MHRNGRTDRQQILQATFLLQARPLQPTATFESTMKVFDHPARLIHAHDVPGLLFVLDGQGGEQDPLQGFHRLLLRVLAPLTPASSMSVLAGCRMCSLSL